MPSPYPLRRGKLAGAGREGAGRRRKREDARRLRGEATPGKKTSMGCVVELGADLSFVNRYFSACNFIPKPSSPSWLVKLR
jgi:hypothetical protein